MSQSAQSPVSTPYEFSLVLGGPIFQTYVRAHMSGTGLEMARRRMLAIIGIVWLPLVVLAVLEGRAFGDQGAPLFRDVEVHARLLLAIPLMLVAEIVCHRRIVSVVRQFLDRGLVTPEDRPRFDGFVASAMRLRNSFTAEIIQLVLAVALHWIGGRWVVERGDSWVGTPSDGASHLTMAGWWYAFVSLPLFRLMLFRWYYRIFIWYRFLWQVRGLNLRLDALHPDKAAGLGFLAVSPTAFTPLLVAHSVVVAGIILNKIWNAGAKLPDFKFEIAGVLAVALLLALPPLFFFVTKLAAAKRKGNAEYGILSSRYVDAFRDKWLSGVETKEQLVGSADIQSLADLSNAYEAVRETRLVPLTRQAIMQLLIVTALPLLPLALTMVPYDELLMRIVGFLF